MLLTKRMTAIVHGQVQGVSFRYYTQLRARKLNLTGYARNLRSGAVEVVAEGAELQLEELREWLKTGSPAAVVRRVDAEFSDAAGEFSRFEIRY